MKAVLRPLLWMFFLALLLAFKTRLEAQMGLQMLLQLPLLFALGWLAAGRREPRALAALNAQGALGLTVLLCLTGVWMIPAVLDLALISPALGLAKHVSWVAAGALMRVSWPLLALELRCFALGNLAWMCGSVGLLYQSAERRLCVNYLLDDQLRTGQGLVGLGLLLGAAACGLAYRGASQDAPFCCAQETNSNQA